MSLTGTQLTDEVQEAVGRVSNPVLIDNTRAIRWLNDAQKNIAEECPEMDCLHFDNKTSLDTTQVLKYAVNEITVGNDPTTCKVCYFFDAFYLDGNESRRLEFLHPDDFDNEYPDPTHSDIAKTRPVFWTHRADISGGYIEMMPLCLTAYCDKNLRFVGSLYPYDFTTETTEVSYLENCDELMIAYAVARAWGYIGEKDNEILWLNKYGVMLDEKKTQSSRYHQWEGNLFYSDTGE